MKVTQKNNHRSGQSQPFSKLYLNHIGAGGRKINGQSKQHALNCLKNCLKRGAVNQIERGGGFLTPYPEA